MRRLALAAAVLAACGAPAARPDPHAQRACPVPPPCACDGGTGESDALERLARAEEERAALLEELARRSRPAQVEAPDGGAPAAYSAQAIAAAQASGWAQVRTALASMETQVHDCDDVIELVGRLRADVAPPPPAPPRLCRDAALRARLAQAALSGSPATGVLSSVKERVDELCGHFDARVQPDERARTVIQTYGEQVDRVARFTSEVAACANATGRREFECTNTYGTIDAQTVPEAQRAHEMVAALQHELVAARAYTAPFPCTTPTLARIDAVPAWRGEMTSAQMPGLVSGARHVCSTLGWDDAALVESSRRLGSLLDSAEANARARKNALGQSVESMRAQLPDGG